MFSTRLLTLVETFGAIRDVIETSNVLTGLPLVASATAHDLEDGRGSTMGIRLQVDLSTTQSFHGPAGEYGSLQIPIRVTEPELYVLPAVIGWDDEGNPVQIEAVQDFVSELQYQWSAQRSWCSPVYIRTFPAQDVCDRLADTVTRRMGNYIREVSLKCNTPSAPHLVRILPLPERFLGPTPGMSAPQRQLAAKIEGARRVKSTWPDSIDLTAGSQDKPLLVCSLAEDGVSPLFSGTPLNLKGTPAKRVFGIRSYSVQNANHPGDLRVKVEGKAQPFTTGIVPLLTAFAPTPYNSLDAQMITQKAGDALTSLVTKRVRIINPQIIRVEQGGIYPHGYELAMDHDGMPRHLYLPNRAVPTGQPLPKEAKVPGRARITDIYMTKDWADGKEGEMWAIEYQYRHPVGSCDKIVTPHGIKGEAVVVKFEAKAFIDGEWRMIDVISSEQNLHKRGTAVLQHGALELVCQQDDTSLMVKVDDTMETIKERATGKLAERFAKHDPILEGRVPVQYRVMKGKRWGKWTNLGMTWVGLTPWMRTANTEAVSTVVSHNAIPNQLITQVSCLRGHHVANKGTKTLLSYYLRETPVVAQQLLDVLSMPVLTPEQVELTKADPNKVMIVNDGEVTYRGKTFRPTVVNRAFETVGTLSMQVLHPEEHRNPYEPCADAGDYPNTLLDLRGGNPEDGQGLLLELPLVSWTPPAAPSKLSLAQCKYMYLPKEFVHKLLKINTTEPITLHPIINRVALYLNSFMEIQVPGSDPNGTRRGRIRDLVRNILLAEATERNGAFYHAYHARKPGIQYVSLALDCCPAGVMFMSQSMMDRYNKMLVESNIKNLPPLTYGSRGLTIRFPITPGKGMQGVIVQPMPSEIEADIVVNSTTAEKCHDGDNDGDLNAVHFPPHAYWDEVDQMRATFPDKGIQLCDRVPITTYDPTDDNQLLEAIMMAELKAKIGPASSVIYRWLALQKWTPENLDEIKDILVLMEALMRSAVKKHILDQSVWKMLGLQFSHDPAVAEEVRCGLMEVAPDDLKDAVNRGMDAYMAFLNRLPARISSAYTVTLGSSRISTTRDSRFTSLLSSLGTDGLLSKLHTELAEGAY